MRARSLWAATAAAITVLAPATSALADTIQVDGDVVAAGQQSTLSLGTIGCNGTATAPVSVWLQRSGTGENNNQNVFANGATVTITASDSSSDLGVSLGQGTLTLPANWQSLPYGNTQYFPSTSTVSASAGSAGSHSATITYTASGAGASGGTVTRSAQLTVNWTSTGCTQNQQPSVIVTGVADGGTYTFGEVPAVGCTVTDPQNSTASTSPIITPDNGDVGQHTATCSYTSASGSATASATYTITPATPSIQLTCTDAVYDGQSHPCSAAVIGVDKQPITGATADIAYSPNDIVDAGAIQATASYGGGGNYTAATSSTFFVISKAQSSVTISCTDPVTYTGAALTPCTATVDGPGTVTGSATLDYSNNVNAGTAGVTATYAGDGNHEGSSAVGTFTIAQAPTTTVLSCPPSVTFTGSALEPCTASVTGAGTITGSPTLDYSNNVNAGTANVTASYAGDSNHEASSAVGTFTIAQAPTTTVVTCPQSLYFTGSALQPCTASVTGPGGLNESVPVTYSGNTLVGTATASASYPGAANYLPSQGSATFQILAWTMYGFFQPVDMNNVVNTVKAGSTVPLKFRMYSGSTEITDTAAVKSFRVAPMTCGTTAPTDDVKITSTGGTSLRYDSTGDQFIQNWQTPKTTGCYQATMTALDGSTISALFKLK